MAYDDEISSVDTLARMLARVVAVTLSERNVEAFASVDRLAGLAPGWDGYDGHAPTPEAIAQAKSFIATMPTDVRSPEVEPSGDGEINLVWRSDAAYLEVGFCGDQQFSFFGKTKTAPEERLFGDVPLSANRLPLGLHWLMKQFADGMPVRGSIAEPAPLAWAS